MAWPDHIQADPEILGGEPVARGTRLAVELILELPAAGVPEQPILADYPELTCEDELACNAQASYAFWPMRTSQARSWSDCGRLGTTSLGPDPVAPNGETRH